MACRRPLIARARPFRVGLITLATLVVAAGADRPAPTDPPVPLGLRPYAIRAHISFDPYARIDRALRLQVVDAWLDLVDRFVGDPWRVDAVAELAPLAAAALETLGADALKPLGAGVDKVWAIQGHRAGPVLLLEGRELDCQTGRLGEVHRVEVRDAVDLPRGLLTLARSLFEPVADVGESKDGGVTFQVQGGAIPPSSPAGTIAPVGSVFRAFRLFLGKDDAVAEIREIPYSYFRVEERVGAAARCSIIKGLGDPLTNRFARRNRVVALGIQPARASTRLRFLLKGDKTPAAGYKLMARAAEPEAKPYEVGITDRDGRVELPPDFAEGLVMVRVIAGNDEPMADLPVMPGETRAERAIIIEARPRTLDLEAKLDALRDTIIDVVASRSRLEARMKARLDGNEYAGFDEAMAEFRKLIPRDRLEAQLNQLKTDAEQTQTATRTLILTKNAASQLDEVQALIARYLDDDAVRALEDAATTSRAERAAEEKAKTKAKPRPK